MESPVCPMCGADVEPHYLRMGYASDLLGLSCPHCGARFSPTRCGDCGEVGADLVCVECGSVLCGRCYVEHLRGCGEVRL